MFTNLNELEKTMRTLLISLNTNDFHPDLDNNRDLAYALYCCCEDGLILNLACDQNANRDYIFQLTSNTHISKKGLQFLKDTSPFGLFKHNLFILLKGSLGFLLGIISTVIAAFIIWNFGWI